MFLKTILRFLGWLDSGIDRILADFLLATGWDWIQIPFTCYYLVKKQGVAWLPASAGASRSLFANYRCFGWIIFPGMR